MAGVTRPRVENASPADLVDWAREGRIRIPSFQRSYTWGRRDVTALFDSLLRGFPIGNLLVWQRPATASVITLGPLTVDAPTTGAAFWVVDGQQRTTSLVGALTATVDTVDPRFRIFFDLHKAGFVSLGRRENPAADLLPVSLSLNTAGVNAWIRERPHLEATQIELADQMVAQIRDYKIPIYVVTGDDEHALREIFDRMNTFGKPLKSAEVFNALHSLSTEQEPSDLRTLSASVRGFGFGEFSEQVLMQSLLAIRGPKVDRDFRNEFKNDGDRHSALALTEKTLGHVVDFLRDHVGIPHVKLLPYMLFVPVLARFVTEFGPPGGRPAELLRRWIWRGSVVGVAPQGNTVGVRQGAAAIFGDPVDSASRLLGRLPTAATWQPDLAQTQLNRAQGKVNALGLLSRAPRTIGPTDAADSRRIDAAEMLDEGALLTLIIADGEELGRGMANRMAHSPEKPGALIGRLAALSGDDELLFSHCLDRECVRMLSAWRHQEFLERRATIVTKVIADHVQDNALFGFSDGPLAIELFEDGA